MLLEKIEKDWVIWSTEPEFEILKNCAEEGKRFRAAYSGKYDKKIDIHHKTVYE